MLRWKFSESTVGIISDCGEIAICIDDTQGFDGVRYYKNYIPTLRSKRSGLKVICLDKESFNLTRSKWVNDKYKNFYEKNGYLPEFFDVYNGIEIKGIAPTISTRSNGAMGSGTTLVIQKN